MDHFDINQAPLEIERKFLIQYPDINELSKMPDYRVVHMEQSYLREEGDFLHARERAVVQAATA